MWTEGRNWTGACGNLLLPARLVSQMAALAKQGSQDQGESGATENGFLARSWLGQGDGSIVLAGVAI